MHQKRGLGCTGFTTRHPIEIERFSGRTKCEVPVVHPLLAMGTPFLAAGNSVWSRNRWSVHAILSQIN
jgi:hypothetical protein